MSKACRSRNRTRCWTRSGPRRRSPGSPTSTAGGSATWCCGTTARPCTGAIPSTSRRGASCIAPRSRARGSRAPSWLRPDACWRTGACSCRRTGSRFAGPCASMRIVDIREIAVPLKSDLKNSSFDFSEMPTSVVAVITDVMRDGRPVAGFGFNSTGRYACGAQMRERFIPRILGADPESLFDARGDNLDPAKILAAMRRREKIGGDAERSIGIGTIEVAVWDAVAKRAGTPLHRVLAERYSGGKVAQRVFCYVGGGWYFPGQTTTDLQDEMRRHLDAGYTMVKMKVGGLPLAEDLALVEAVKSILPAGD